MKKTGILFIFLMTLLVVFAQRQKTSGDYYGDGEYKFRSNDFRGAIEEYKKVLAISPKDDNTFWRIGSCYFNLKEYLSAKDNFSQAINLSKKDFYYDSRGQAEYFLKEYTHAIADFDVA